jgi:hypothetical protein
LKLKGLKLSFLFSTLAMSLYLYQAFQSGKDIKKPKVSTKVKSKPSATKKSNTPVESSIALPKTRNPASVKRAPVKKLKRGERVIIGNGAGNYTDPKTKLVLINSYNKNWKTLLEKKLNHLMPEKTIVSYQHIESQIQMRGKKGLLREVVTVKTQLPDGRTYHYDAIVDPQDGKVTTTWNYQKSEKHPLSLKATTMAN